MDHGDQNRADEPRALAVLARGKDTIVVDKPPGVRSTRQGADDRDCVEAWLDAGGNDRGVARTRKRSGRAVWAVHQLDRGTGGCLLFVTKKAAAARWQAALARADGGKRYLALVAGVPGFSEQVVEEPIGPAAQRGSFAVSRQGKPAKTRLRVLARGDGAALVEAALYSGRTHQVRVHLAHIGHPLFGDPRYGPAAHRALGDDEPGFLALHAAGLTVRSEGERLAARSALPDAWRELAARHRVPLASRHFRSTALPRPDRPDDARPDDTRPDDGP